MKLVSRALAIVTPKQPYVDWANVSTNRQTLTPEEAVASAVAYLIPEFESRGDAHRFVELNYEQIFEQQLFSWMCDETTWPTKRNLQLFRQWFDVRIVDVVYDLGKDELSEPK